MMMIHGVEDLLLRELVEAALLGRGLPAGAHERAGDVGEIAERAGG